ncbi:FAD-dependent monooxygenase [Glaciecola sp. XM2]|uniref:FAD-dependent monooxygenase n=1 Tax=Glaciecola sp. XM2 TaxID=1914931 RepID=UPI001BDE79F2|nr:FAD-dependent monooxygenase [Glaciecola sp. XM2]MBT1451010.1 FAD-dependent monooxygenase [Glaciecola sp. XM2]
MSDTDSSGNATVLDVEVCILGAGMIGAASACTFAAQGLRVALIEPYMPHAFAPEQDPDLRVSALNRHSMDLLDSLHALPHIYAMRYRSYDTLEVWEDEFAKTRFSAQDVKEHQLGIFVENRLVQLALLRSIEENFSQNVSVINASATHIDVVNAKVALDNQSSVQARFLLGTEGAQSPTRKAAGIGQTAWQYAQRANLIGIKLSESIDDTTWQQFTPSGPLALLPMHEQHACLVWYGDDKMSEYIQSLDKTSLKEAIVEHFPQRLGDFEVVDKAGFPLARMHANQYWRHKAVLAGDSAHTINPLAGQGVNLGFKDVKALGEAIKSHGINDLDNAFRAYEKKRRAQNLLMMSAMDGLYMAFSNDIKPLKFARNAALMLANSAGPLKNTALKYAMGL